MAGRPERPLEPDGSAQVDLAIGLRKLKNDAGLTFVQLAAITHYSTTALQLACSGRQAPSRPVLEAFVRACGDQPKEWTARHTAAAAGRAVASPGDAPGSAGADFQSVAKSWPDDNLGEVGGGPAPVSTTEPLRRRHRRGWLVPVSAGVAALVTALTLSQHRPTATVQPVAAAASTAPSARAQPLALAADSKAASDISAGSSSVTRSRHIEQEWAKNGAMTFSTVSGGGPNGPHVKFAEEVDVLCKKYGPTMASVSPDGYWYLLGGKWQGRFYAAANTFLNGDAPDAEKYTHNTEKAVPDC